MLVRFLLGLSPILIVLLLMLGFKWGGTRAGAAGWLTALIVSVLFFGAGVELLAYSQMRALLLTLYVLYVIWMALIFYNVVLEAGAIASIGQGIVRVTGDRVLQLLMLSWVFSSFLQGVAGYGVPIAVVAPLLIGLGFPAIQAVAAVAIGHAWAVTFGSMAASFNALIATSGMPGQVLAPSTALLLGLVCYLCGGFAALTAGGFAALKHALPAILWIGTVMAGAQYGFAVAGMWNIAAFVAGLMGLGATALVARLPLYRSTAPRAELSADGTAAQGSRVALPLSLAIVPYALLIGVVSLAELAPPVHALLNSVRLEVAIPETVTSLGFTTPSTAGQAISVFGHAGALLLYASIAAYLVLASRRCYAPGSLRTILSNTVRSAVSSSLGIAAMVGFALIMEQSGMTGTVAGILSLSGPALYSFASPFIGLLGAFMTGSNTNSNVLFTGMQRETAALLRLPVTLILGAQTAGGAIGGMLAPARIIVGASTAGLAGKEGQVLRRTIPCGLIITAVVGLIVWLAAA